MTVRVSKPEFNLREKLSELDKPVGTHGNEILKSNSLQETCAIVGSGRKNFVINGGFEIWQRGLSWNSFNSTRYTADRWLQYAAGGSTITVTRQQFTTGQKEVPGNPKYYYRMDNTPDADDSWLELFHRIEDVRRFSDVPVTLSFWMRASKPQEDLIDQINVSQNFGTSGSSIVTVTSPKFNVSTQWQKYEFTFDLPSIAGKTINVNSFLQLHWIRPSVVAADTYYDLAQVQLEYGRGATPFEQRSYGEEFNLCERYYQLIGGIGNASGEHGTTGYNGGNTNGWHAYPGWCWANSTSSTRVMFRQRMRRQPDVTIIGTISGTSGMGNGKYGIYGGSVNDWAVPGSWSITDVNDHSFRIQVGSYSGLGLGNAVGYYMFSGTGFTVDAELPATYSP